MKTKELETLLSSVLERKLAFLKKASARLAKSTKKKSKRKRTKNLENENKLKSEDHLKSEDDNYLSLT